MKKWILISFAIILLLITALYFLIPGAHNYYYQATANCPQTAVARQITNHTNWAWWPGRKKDDTNYSYKNFIYKIEKVLYNGIETTVFNNTDSLKGILQYLYYGNDSTQFQWTSTYIFSPNPFKRFKQYIQLNKFKNNVEDLLDDIKEYFGNQQNVYGMIITKQRVRESYMISVKDTFSHYPSAREIYKLIGSIKEYILRMDSEETDHPMLHVERYDSTTFEAMVAIPTKHELPSEGKFRLKKMVVGNILMAEVKGGMYTIMKGEEELTNYVNDYKKTSPAIPFQSLVTNRLLETDTLKWITKLYYPIFF